MTKLTTKSITEAQMTRADAEQFVRECVEDDDGPESYAEACDIFAALYGRRPDAADGDLTQVWSLCCAAVETP